MVVKQARNGAVSMDGSSKQQNQHQGPSCSGPLSSEPAEKEAGDNRSFALAGLSDDITDGKDNVSSTKEWRKGQASTSW